MLFEDTLTQVGNRWCKRVVITKKHPMYDELLTNKEFRSYYLDSIDEKKGRIKGGLVYGPNCICPKSFISRGILIGEGAYVEESLFLNFMHNNPSVFYSHVRGNQTKILRSNIISIRGLDIANSQIIDSTLETNRGKISRSIITNSTNLECRGTHVEIADSKIDGAQLDYSRLNRDTEIKIVDSVIEGGVSIINKPYEIINSMIMGGIHNSSSKERIEDKSLIWKEN